MTPAESWLALGENLKSTVYKGKGADRSAARSGVDDFLTWALRVGLPFPADPSKALADYESTLDVYRNKAGKLNKAGTVALEVAREMLERARKLTPAEAEAEAEEAEAEAEVKASTIRGEAQAFSPHAAPRVSPHNTSPHTNEEDQMPRDRDMSRDDELEMQAEAEEAFEDDDEAEAEAEDEVEEAPPPKQRRRGANAPRIVVQMPPTARRAPATSRAEPRGSALRNILPRTEKIRIYKRDEMGRRQHIDDFTVDEIGPNTRLDTFIREYIDPQFGNETGVTQYIAYELDPRTGREKQPESTITIRSEVPQEAPDAFGQVRKAMHLISELQSVTQQQQQTPNSDLLRGAQRAAAEKGDIQSMMMLLLMERLLGGSSNNMGDLVLKVLDRLDKLERKNNPPEFSGAGFSGFVPPPPPMYMPPPPPPPPAQTSPTASSIEKVVELAVAKLVQPPPPLSEQLKEMLTLKQLAGNDAAVESLKQELAALRSTIAASKPSAGIEDSLANFEKFTTIVKSVAPQVTGDDGFLKGLFTSEVGKVLGDAIAKAVQAQTAPPPSAAAPAPAQVPTQAPAQAPAQAAPQAAPQPSPPPAVVEAVKAFRVAQTPEVQAQRFIDLVFAMWMSGVEHYRKLLAPALESLNKAEESVQALAPARRTALALLAEVRPQLATPDFVDRCLAALAMRAGVDKLPDTLLKTAGKWTVDYAGNVLLLEQLGARPVEEKPEAGVGAGTESQALSASSTAPVSNEAAAPAPSATEPAPAPSPSPPFEVVELEPVRAESEPVKSAPEPLKLTQVVEEKPGVTPKGVPAVTASTLVA